MSIREQMLEAQQHIQKKQYAEAREILMGIDHPKAREWLQKLDEIALSPSQPQNSAQQKGRYIPEDWTPRRPPFDPLRIPAGVAFTVFIINRATRYTWRGEAINLDETDFIGLLPEITLLIIGIAFAFLLFTGVPLATNWRRLGRPRWSTYTLLVTIPALIAFPIVMLLQAFYVERMNVMLTFLMMVGIAILTGIGVAYPTAMVILQVNPYRKWNERDFRPMLYHQYPWDNALTGIFVFIGLCILGIFIVYEEMPPFKTLNTGDVTLNYPWHWRAASCPGEPNIECIYAIRRRQSDRNYHINFVKYSRGPWVTSADVEEGRRANFLAESPDVVVAEVVDFTLDGLPARYRDTIENDSDSGCTERVRRIYVVYGDLAYHFVSSACLQNWAAYEPQFMAIVNTLDLH